VEEDGGKGSGRKRRMGKEGRERNRRKRMRRMVGGCVTRAV
jgi:hypothetical protein